MQSAFEISNYLPTSIPTFNNNTSIIEKTKEKVSYYLIYSRLFGERVVLFNGTEDDLKNAPERIKESISSYVPFFIDELYGLVSRYEAGEIDEDYLKEYFKAKKKEVTKQLHYVGEASNITLPNLSVVESLPVEEFEYMPKHKEFLKIENGVIMPSYTWKEWLEDVKRNIHKVSSLEEWLRVVEQANRVKINGLDIETTGLDPHTSEIRLIQLAFPDLCEKYHSDNPRFFDSLWKFPQRTPINTFVLDLNAMEGSEARKEAVLAVLKLIESKDVIKVIHNAAFDLSFFRKEAGRRIAPVKIFDTMIASQLVTAGDFIPESQIEKWCAENGVTMKQGQKTEFIDKDGHIIKFEKGTQKRNHPYYPTHSLQQVAHRHLDIFLDKELQKSDWGDLFLTDEQFEYAACDAAVVLPLYEVLLRLIKKNKLEKTAVLEFDCIPAVVEIEYMGMPFDALKAREMMDAAFQQLTEYRNALVSIAEKIGFKPIPKKSSKVVLQFNPDSSIDICDCLRILGEKEGIVRGDYFYMDEKEFKIESMDDTLAYVQTRMSEESDIYQFILNLREYRKFKKFYDFLKKWIELRNLTTGRLHTSLRQLNPQGVGRFSASSPNLQQVSRDSQIRALFKAPEGRKIIIADYSNIEMRIMAQLSMDATLIKAFRHGVDVHKLTASNMAHKSMDEVSKTERQSAKPVNFGCIYGMQSSTLRMYAEANYGTKMTEEEAEKAREAFFRTYPGIEEWHKKQNRRGYDSGFEVYWRHTAEKGFIKEYRPTIRTLGNRLRVWAVEERETRDRERKYLRKVGNFTELYNSPDQGTGADIMKKALGMLYKEFLNRNLEDVYLIGCVHDEVLVETPEEIAEEVRDIVQKTMVAAANKYITVIPTEVEAGVCNDWSEK